MQADKSSSAGGASRKPRDEMKKGGVVARILSGVMNTVTPIHPERQIEEWVEQLVDLEGREAAITLLENILRKLRDR